MVADAIVAAYAKSLAGGVAPCSQRGTVALARVELPLGHASSWAVIARQLDRNDSVVPPLLNKLRARLGTVAGSREFSFDYPTRGAVLYVGPSTTIELFMDVVDVLIPTPPNPAPLIYAATVVPFQGAPAASPTYTTTEVVTPVSSKTWTIPYGATAYRVTSATDPLTAQTVVAAQECFTGAVVSVDSTTSTNWNGTANGIGLDKSAWLPVVPQAQVIRLWNTDAVNDRSYTVQFLLST